MNTGLLHRIKTHGDRGGRECAVPGVSAMTLMQMMSAFMLLMWGGAMALLFVALEKIARRKRKKSINKIKK